MENLAKRWSELEKKIMNGPDEDLIVNHNNALNGIAGRNLMLDNKQCSDNSTAPLGNSKIDDKIRQESSAPPSISTMSSISKMEEKSQEDLSQSNTSTNVYNKNIDSSTSKESISQTADNYLINNNNSNNYNTKTSTISENETSVSLFGEPNTNTARENKMDITSISESDALDEAERLIRLAKNKSEKMNEFKKTLSIDSIKNKTIVTPIDLEPTANDDQETQVLRNQVNIIKLEDLNDQHDLVSNGKAYKSNDAIVSVYLNGSNGKITKSDSLDAASYKYKIKDGTSSEIDRISIKLDDNDDVRLILNDLFDWLLWINHTLDSQIVVLGNLDEIQQSILKLDVGFFFKHFLIFLEMDGLSIYFFFKEHFK